MKTLFPLITHFAEQLKIGDFGLARWTTDPIVRYSTNMVTLWYRPPDLVSWIMYCVRARVC